MIQAMITSFKSQFRSSRYGSGAPEVNIEMKIVGDEQSIYEFMNWAKDRDIVDFQADSLGVIWLWRPRKPTVRMERVFESPESGNKTENFWK